MRDPVGYWIPWNLSPLATNIEVGLEVLWSTEIQTLTQGRKYTFSDRCRRVLFYTLAQEGVRVYNLTVMGNSYTPEMCVSKSL